MSSLSGSQRGRSLLAHLVTVAMLSMMVWLAVGSSGVAQAHAVLDSSTPVDQSVLDAPPGRVSLTFTEKVTFTPSAIRVFDSEGERVDTGDVRLGENDRTVTVGLGQDGGAGSFVVAWKVVSADAHPIHGGFVYSVGSPSSIADLDKLIATGDDPGWVVIGQALRGLGYLWSIIAVGGALFVAFVGDRRDLRRGVRVGVLVAAVVTALFTLGQLPQKAALATGLGAASLFNEGVLSQVLASGVLWTQLAFVLAAAVAAVSVRLGSRSARQRSAAAALALIGGAFAASGHTRTASPVPIGTIAVLIHGAAAVVWAGLVLHTLWSMTQRAPETNADDASDTAAVVNRLSRAATIALALLAASGGVLAFMHVGSINGVTSTTYGRLVAAKVVLVGLIAFAAGFNHFRLVPLMRRGSTPKAVWQYLRRSLLIEALGLVAVVGVTGVLVNVIPARTVIESSRVFSQSASLGEGSVNVVIDPASTGPTTMHIYLLDAQGRVDDNAESVVVHSSIPGRNIGPISRNLQRIGPGHYRVSGTLFPVSGSWKLEVEVRVDEFTQQTAALSTAVRA